MSVVDCGLYGQHDQKNVGHCIPQVLVQPRVFTPARIGHILLAVSDGNAASCQQRTRTLASDLSLAEYKKFSLDDPTLWLSSDRFIQLLSRSLRSHGKVVSHQGATAVGPLSILKSCQGAVVEPYPKFNFAEFCCQPGIVGYGSIRTSHCTSDYWSHISCITYIMLSSILSFWSYGRCCNRSLTMLALSKSMV